MSSLKKYLNVYDFETVLKGSGETIKYKGLSTNAIKKLLVYENETDPLKEEEILDSLLKIAVTEEDFNPDNMYILDRYYLFIKIREATKGNIYKFPSKCSKCEKEVIQEVDLNDLIIDKPESFDEELKLGELTFKMSYPTRKKQKELFKSINRNLSDTNKRIEMGLADIAGYIEEINSPEGKIEVDYKELIDFIGDLPESALTVIKD
jgi:hypothetical protein